MTKPNLTDPSDDVLVRLPARAFTFISTLSTSRPIFAILATRGFDKDALADGWTKLHAVSGYAPGAAAAAIDVSPELHAALVEIDAWDEPNFAITTAATAVEFPSAYRFLMDGLAPAQGRGALLTVGTYLRRFDALESGKGRDKSEHKTDKAAIAKLAKRGITKEVRAHLKKLVALLQGGPGDDESLEVPAAEALPDATRAPLLDLYQWFFEWSETARALLARRRDYLIRLGLGQRKAKKKSAPPGGGGTPGGGGAGSGGSGTGGAPPAAT